MNSNTISVPERVKAVKTKPSAAGATTQVVVPNLLSLADPNLRKDLDTATMPDVMSVSRIVREIVRGER